MRVVNLGKEAIGRCEPCKADLAEYVARCFHRTVIDEEGKVVSNEMIALCPICERPTVFHES